MVFLRVFSPHFIKIFLHVIDTFLLYNVHFIFPWGLPKVIPSTFFNYFFFHLVRKTVFSTSCEFGPAGHNRCEDIVRLRCQKKLGIRRRLVCEKKLQPEFHQIFRGYSRDLGIIRFEKKLTELHTPFAG